MDGDVEKFIKNSKSISVKTAFDFMLQTAKGLGYMHCSIKGGKKPIFHGDLAVRNLLLQKDESKPSGYVIKVADFGKSVSATKKFEQTYSADTEVDMEAMNPWRWMPVELFQGGRINAESDIWSYGVTSWEIFAGGRVPYAGMVNFQNLLRNGYRLPRPSDSPMSIYIISKLYEHTAAAFDLKYKNVKKTLF